MKHFLTAFSLLAFWFYNAQVGIKTENQKLPAGYVFPHHSAVLDLYADNLGLLLPNVQLTSLASLTSTTSPISNPVEGLIVFNSSEATKKGIYVWQNNDSDDNKKYNKLFTFNETPKFINLKITKDLKILQGANYGQGSFFSVSSPSIYNWYTGNPTSYDTILELDKGYFDSVEMKTFTDPYFGKMNGIVLPQGDYTISMNFKLKTKSSYLTNRSEAIKIDNQPNNNFYDIGYYSDINYYPMTNGTVDPYNYDNIRSESHTLSKIDCTNNIIFFNTIKLEGDTFIVFNIGRMQGTSYRDAVDLLKGSNIKITKISY